MLFGAVDVVGCGLVGGEASFSVMVVEGYTADVFMPITVVIVEGVPGWGGGVPVISLILIVGGLVVSMVSVVG